MSRRAQLGMVMFLIAEAVFFFLLILAFTYFRAMPRLSSAAGWLLTIALLASVVSLWRTWRWVTIAFGAAFLIGILWTSSSVLTGIHGLHIFAGMIALALVPTSALRAMGLYWVFFTAVWLVIFVIAVLP